MSDTHFTVGGGDLGKNQAAVYKSCYCKWKMWAGFGSSFFRAVSQLPQRAGPNVTHLTSVCVISVRVCLSVCVSTSACAAGWCSQCVAWGQLDGGVQRAAARQCAATHTQGAIRWVCRGVLPHRQDGITTYCRWQALIKRKLVLHSCCT